MNIKMDLSTTEQACLQFALEVAIHSSKEGIAEEILKGDNLGLSILKLTLARLQNIQSRLQAEGLAVYSLEDVVEVKQFLNKS